jgi:pimeloyl-ACP methyl ester carboxylesterase
VRKVFRNTGKQAVSSPSEAGFYACERPAGLLVILHGWNDDTRSMADLLGAARAIHPNFDCYVPSLPIRCFLSRTRAVDLSERLFADIDRKITERRYGKIILVGHSFGAALARAVWAQAQGARLRGNLALTEPKPWAASIKRLILIAGVNRGWDPHLPVGPDIRIRQWFGNVIENICGRSFLVLDIRRGAPFLTTLRLQILRIQRRIARRDAPIVVNLIGTFDNVVAPGDNIDLATNHPVFHLEVERSGHASILHFWDRTAGDIRYRAFKLALSGTAEELTAQAMSPDFIAEMVGERAAELHVATEPLAPAAAPNDPAPQAPADVVFIIHGIRDYGFWTKRLANRLKTFAIEQQKTCHTITSSYGYFPMGAFLLRAERSKRVGWFLDQYVTACATYPEGTRFHFVGHSHGTYLLAAAIDRCAAARFEHVVFAGSVVSSRFKWADFTTGRNGEAPQIRKILNYVASEDWVVATVPRALEWISYFGQGRHCGLGAAGHSGFTEAAEGLEQIRYIKGKHSAAIRPDTWDGMSSFLLADTPQVPAAGEDGAAIPTPRLVARHPHWMRAVAAASPVAIPGIAILLAGIAAYLLVLIDGQPWSLMGSVTSGRIWAAIILVFYLWALGRILTKI